MRYKGSITIFMSMTILMSMALIFSLIEVTHFAALSVKSNNITKIGIESIFAEYNRVLWEQYGILAIDGGYGMEEMNMDKLENRLGEYVLDNFNPSIESGGKYSNFTRAAISTLSMDEYALISDSNAAALFDQANIALKSNLPTQMLSVIDGYMSGKDEIDESEAEDILMQIQTDEDKSRRSNTQETSDIDQPDGDFGFVNPIDMAEQWRAASGLSLVIRDMSMLSDKTGSGYNLPSKRNLNKGNISGPVTSKTDMVFYTQYIKQFFSNYTHPKETKGYQYEWEYLIGGKESDIENLEATVNKLIALREVQNLISINKDTSKVSIASGIAITIAALLMMPEMEEVFKAAILAAWAYLESILDVRLLLSGGRLPLVKTSEEWTSQILLFPSYAHPSVTAKDCEKGLDYTDYLSMMTMLMSERTVGLRSLDVLEYSLRNNQGYEKIRIDNFIYSANLQIEYAASPIFANVIYGIDFVLEGYKFKRRESLSYI